VSQRYQARFRELALRGYTARAIRTQMTEEGCDLSQYTELQLVSNILRVFRGLEVEW